MSFGLNIVSSIGYYPYEFLLGDPKRGAIVAGIHLGSNLLSGIYEYVRHVKKKAEKK